MIVLDSDHLSILMYPENPRYERLVAAMNASTDADFAVTVVSLEEQMRGWLAAINRARDPAKQVPYYTRLTGLVNFYGSWRILPFDFAAAAQFAESRKSGIRIGTMDLKIACIALAQDALLLSANLRDFERVAGLRVESWI